MRHKRQLRYLGSDQLSTRLDAQCLPNVAQFAGHVAHGDVIFQAWREGTTGHTAPQEIFEQDGEPGPWDAALLDVQAHELAGWTTGLDGRQRLATHEVFSRSRFAQA